MKHFFRAVSALVALGVMQTATAACTTYISSVPYVINAPGEYCLLRSLRLTAPANAITINSNNVTVNLQGYSIFTSRGEDGMFVVGIYSTGRNNITVRNGRLRGFTKGVEMQSDILSAGNFLVEGLIVRSSGQTGINIRGGNSTIQDNVVSDTQARFAPSQFAIGIDVSAYGGTATVRNNRVDNTRGSGLVPPDADGNPSIGAEGLVVDGAPSATIENNTITDTTSGKDRALGLVYTCFPNAGVVCTNATASSNEILNSSSARGAVGFTIVGSPGGGGANLYSVNNDVENFAEGIKYIFATGTYRANVVAGAVTPYVGGRPFGVNDIEP